MLPICDGSGGLTLLGKALLPWFRRRAFCGDEMYLLRFQAKTACLEIELPIIQPAGGLSASVAQLAEQLICNQPVVGSNPSAGSEVGKTLGVRNKTEDGPESRSNHKGHQTLEHRVCLKARINIEGVCPSG